MLWKYAVVAARGRARARRWAWGVLAIACLPCTAAAQTADPTQLVPLLSTPKGALPPAPLPMPASRDHNYWGFRLQAGERVGGRGSKLVTVAGGVDWQLLGGSVIGVTAGAQQRECIGDACGGEHLFLELRGRFGLLTGGPSLGAVFGDHSANAVIGVEMGVGFAPDVAPRFSACTIDLGLPISLSMLQGIRLVTFVTPGLAWSLDCSPAGPPNDASFVTGFGIGVQKLGLRGLDVSVGMQKIFENDTGYQLGFAVSYFHVR